MFALELVFYILERAILFTVSSIPLIVTVYLRKVLKISLKGTATVVLMLLLQCIFFWFHVKIMWLVGYQCIPFLLSFILMLIERISIKDVGDKSQE